MNSVVARTTLELLNEVPRESVQLHEFHGRDHWFSATAQSALAEILFWQQNLSDNTNLEIWYRFSLSRIINRISRQDSETRYVARENFLTRDEVIRMFVESLAYSTSYLQARGPLAASPIVEFSNSSTRIPLDDETIDCVITSPPYANTMDYYLYHKQRMNVLGYDFKSTQNTEIGSRWEFSSLKKPLSQWEDQYKGILSEIRRVLRPGARCALIIGDSQIAGELIDAAMLTADLSRSADLKVSSITSTSMTERSRSFSRAFQRPHKREHIIVLEAA